MRIDWGICSVYDFYRIFYGDVKNMLVYMGMKIRREKCVEGIDRCGNYLYVDGKLTPEM